MLIKDTQIVCSDFQKSSFGEHKFGKHLNPSLRLSFLTNCSKWRLSNKKGLVAYVWSKCDVSLFLDAMICCTIFAIGLQTLCSNTMCRFFLDAMILYNICNSILPKRRFLEIGTSDLRVFYKHFLRVRVLNLGKVTLKITSKRREIDCSNFQNFSFGEHK